MLSLLFFLSRNSVDCTGAWPSEARSHLANDVKNTAERCRDNKPKGGDGMEGLGWANRAAEPFAWVGPSLRILRMGAKC